MYFEQKNVFQTFDHTKSETWFKITESHKMFSKFRRITKTKTLNLLYSTENTISQHVTEIEWSDRNLKKDTQWIRYSFGVRNGPVFTWLIYVKFLDFDLQ